MSGPSVVFWLVVPFLDPRRWLGALFAVAGVVVSIVATLLPSIMQRISRPPPSAPPHRRTSRTLPSESRHIFQKRPYASPIQPAITSCRPNRRPRTGEVSLAPRVTFTREPPHRSSSTGCILSSSASNSPSSSSSILVHGHPVESSTLLSQSPNNAEPSPTPSLPSPTPSPPAPSSQIIFPSTSLPLEDDSAPVFPFNSTASLQSLDCLDLATPTKISSSHVHHELSPSPRRPFHLPLPKIGFGKRRSTPNIKTNYELAGQRHGMKRRQTSDGEKRNSSVTRSTTVSNSSLPTRNLSPLPPSCKPSSTTLTAYLKERTARRKFSIFSREGRIKKDVLTHPSPTVPDVTPPVPPLPTRFALARAPSFNASVALVSSSTAITISLSPLVQTQTPPPRPTRTDPYKTHGVPVPGSERAQAFLRAEREVRERRLRSQSVTHIASGNAKDISEAVPDVPMMEAVSEFGVVSPTPVPASEQTRRNCGRSCGSECRQDPEPRQQRWNCANCSGLYERTGRRLGRGSMDM